MAVSLGVIVAEILLLTDADIEKNSCTSRPVSLCLHFREMQKFRRDVPDV
jgi:hypothetical protein